MRRPFPSLAFACFALILAAASASTKAAGLAWLMICVMGLWTFVRSGQRASGVSSTLTPVDQAARIWLLACLIASVLRIIPQAFWHDDWGRRHGELRLLLGALAAVALVKWPPFYRLSAAQGNWVGHALALACASGLVTTGIHGRDTPSHPIAWAVSLSLLICLLAPLALGRPAGTPQRKWWLLAVMMGLMGVLLSQSRGAYGILIWLLWLGFVTISGQALERSTPFRSSVIARMTLAGLALALLLYLQPAWLTGLARHVMEAWQQVWIAQAGLNEAANTSVGARLYMWSKAADAIELHPLLGYGKENSVAMIQAWGREIGSAEVQHLDHLHNEFLDAWISHGLPGLASLLALAGGMALMVRTLWQSHPVAARALLGILFMHLSAGLTNVNLAHNYYGAMLSLTVTLALLLAAAGSGEEDDRANRA